MVFLGVVHPPSAQAIPNPVLSIELKLSLTYPTSYDRGVTTNPDNIHKEDIQICLVSIIFTTEYYFNLINVTVTLYEFTLAPLIVENYWYVHSQVTSIFII